MKQIDLEEGRPDVATAMSRLNNRIYQARATGDRACKIIHGYGSTGKGGAIKSACLSELRGYKRRGLIKDFCPGISSVLSQKTEDVWWRHSRSSTVTATGPG